MFKPFTNKPVFKALFAFAFFAAVLAYRGDSAFSEMREKSVAPNLSAVKSGVLDTSTGGDLNGNGIVNPGDLLTYTVTLQNSGMDPATSVNFSDTIDANTTLVSNSLIVSPIAVNDVYASTGNVGITVPAASGLLANDLNPNGSGTLTITSAPTASAQGGNVSITTSGASAGAFTYNPPAGFEGPDSFTYTLDNGTGLTDTATVTINVSGMIWFINNGAASCTTVTAGCGRLSNPFSTLEAFRNLNNGSGNNPGAGDNIFIYESATAYTGGVTLLKDQLLIGQDATSPLATLAGVTLPAFSNALPAMNSGNSTVASLTNSGGTNITLNNAAGNNNRIYGLTVGAGNTGISGINFVSLTVRDVIINGAAQALNLNNGALDVVFGAVTVSSRTTTGLVLNTVSGTAQFGATTIPNTGSAGGYGMRIENSSAAVTLASATISNSFQTVAQNDADTDFIPDNDGDGDAIFLKNNTGSFNLNGGTLSNCGNDCIDARSQNNFNLSNVTISTPGTQANGGISSGTGGHGIQAINLTGTTAITGATIQGFNTASRDGFRLINTVSTALTVNVTGTTFQNATGSNGIMISGRNASNINFTVGGSTNNPSTNCTFQNLAGSAINHAAGDTAGSTSVVNLTVRHSTFQNAQNNGLNTVSGRNIENARANIIIENNTFNNVARVASSNTGVITVNGDGLGSNNQLSLSIQNNTISNIGATDTSCGGANCISYRGIQVFIDDNTKVSGDIVINNNTLTNIQRDGIFVDIANSWTGSNVTARVTNNIVGTDAARVGIGGGGQPQRGIFIERRRVGVGGLSTNVVVSNNTVRNGNGGSGSTLNSTGIFVRADEDANMGVMISGNNVDTLTSNSVAEIRADTSNTTNAPGANPFMCLNLPGNTIPAGAAGLIELRENVGALDVKQPNTGAISSTHNSATVNVVFGTPQFNSGCSAPTSFAQNFNGFESGASETAEKDASQIIQENNANVTVSALPTTSDLYRIIRDTAKGIFDLLSKISFGTTVSAEENAFANAVPLSGETVTKNLGTIPAGEQVVVRFKATVDANIPSNKFSVSNQANVTAAGGININSNTVVTTVVHPPAISKAFGAQRVEIGGTTTLTFTVTNPNPSQAFTQIAFTDNLPAGMVVADTPGVVNNCSSGTVTATAGAGTISYLGGTRAANSNCTIRVNVKATAEGTLNNTTGNISSLEGGTGGTASASLTVFNSPVVTKSFTPSSIPLNSTSVLNISIQNTNASQNFTGVSFTDTLPSGVTAADTSRSECGGTLTVVANVITLSGASVAPGATCSVNVTVTGASAGTKNNTVTVDTANAGTGYSANATLTVVAPATIAKSFSPASITVNETSTLTISITNPAANTVALTGVGVTDNFPAGLEVDATPSASNSCSTGTFSPASGATSVSVSGATVPVGATCNFSVKVRATTTGSKVNTTGNVSSTNGGSGATATATLTVTNVLATWTGATSTNWHTATNWNPAVVPNASDDVRIPGGMISNEPSILSGGMDVTVASLEIQSGRTLTIQSGRTLTVTGALINNGTINNAGSFTFASMTGTGTVSFTGVAQQTIPAGTYANLTINNAAGAVLGGDVTVEGTLTLTNGNITTGVHTLIIGTAGTVSRTSGHVIGNVRKEFASVNSFTGKAESIGSNADAAAAVSFTYPVGTTNGYSPVTVNATAGAGGFTVSATQNFLPETDQNQSIRRFWSLTSAGITQADITFQYLDADVPTGANEAGFKFIRRSAGMNELFAPSSFDTTANTFTLNGVTQFSDWTLGNLAPTAANVNIGGRVFKPNGNGLPRAQVLMTDLNGNTRVAFTNPFGYFNFADAAVGETYTFSVNHKKLTFPQQVLTVLEERDDLNFVPSSNK